MQNPFRFLLVSIAFVGQMLFAAVPEFDDPALLLDNAAWLKGQKEFRAVGSETRAYLDLVTILYDFDNGRPWGKEYFPEANRRLGAFRSALCEKVALEICSKPGILWHGGDIATAQAGLLNADTLATLKQRWNVDIAVWTLPLRPPLFTLTVGRASSSETQTAAFWTMQPKAIKITTLYDEVLPDATNYRAGFDEKDSPAMFAVNPEGLFLNDRQIRLRAVEFAAAWKRAMAAIKRRPPQNRLVDAEAVQFQMLFDEQTAEFARLYPELRAKVEGHAELIARFEAERARNDYPEEVYQHVAFAQLSSLARMQGAYFVLAAEQRRGRAAGALALEALLTLQRHSPNVRAFAAELSTLLQPLSSHAYILDENANASLVLTYVAENLKAVLGLDHYTGRGTFPAGAQGLLAPEIFEDPDFAATAPEAAAALGGRKLDSLSADEQLRILRLYLQPQYGKVRGFAVDRLGTLFLQNASAEDLRRIADLIENRESSADKLIL